MVQDFLSPEQSQEEALLQQAIEFINQGEFSTARDLLTRLLRSDQNNATYWVWMSATMETSKERLYCLQTAYRLDPTNEAAKRGLLLLGALLPDESVQPFPMNHPRAWEDKFKLEEEKPKKENRARNRRIAFQLGGIALVGLLLIGSAIYGLGHVLGARPEPTFAGFGTPRPTVTPVPGFSSNHVTLPPLATLLSATYTPTPIYYATPHTGLSLDSYNGAMRAYSNGQWNLMITLMQQVTTAEPHAVDAYFFIGEAKRLSGDYKGALAAYQEAINIDPNFAPIYLGRARANMALNPKKDVINDLDAAVKLDPNFAEAYVQRAQYYYDKGDYKSALTDLDQAAHISPDSPLIELWLAKTDLGMDNPEGAVAAAKRANQLDVTDLESYLVLGMAYQANGQTNEAVSALQTYAKYEPDNADAFTILGSAYYNRGEYQNALDNLAQALRLDGTSSQAYYWQGETYLALGQDDDALNSFKKSFSYNQNSFDAGLAVGRALIAKKEYNNAYIEIIKIEKLADTDAKRAQFLYYRAISLEQINQPDAAYNDWKALLDLPADAVPADMLATARAHLANLRSPTSPPPTSTATRTPLPTATRFPTATSALSPTSGPSTTPSPAGSPSTTFTPTATATP